MPKRGGSRPWGGYNNGGGRHRGDRGDYGGGNSYSDDHDDRDKVRTVSARRVSFKPSGVQHNRGGLKGRMAEMAIRSRLEDDEEMGEQFAGNKFRDGKLGGRRKGSPIPKGKFGSIKKLLPSTFGWYQVTIAYGQKYPRDELIRQILTAISPEIFIPHHWRTEKTSIIFYVDDYKIAEIIQGIDRMIQMPDGFRLSVKVRSGIPQIPVDDAFKEKMKLAMAKRYNASTKALDLSRFHADPEFKDTFCGLFRPAVLAAALEIITKNIPDLEALNLNENQIAQLDSFRNIGDKLPNLKVLYLGENRLQSIASMTLFRNVPIVELVLKSNPLRQRYKDNAQYISEVRRKFPKLLKLDGQELEPQIVFDVSDTYSLPQAKASFLCDVAGADIIRQFLEQYFMIFDSDNRQPLLDAYHEQAMLSMSLPPASQAGRLNSFWKFNRNFLRTFNDPDNQRARLIKVGRLPVVSMLSELPKTQHDPQSFSVDLVLFTPKLISFTVAGLFKESGSEASSSSNSNSEIRYFQRQFVVVPAGSGFCIRNELIFITNATHSQAKTFLKPAEQAPAVSQQNVSLQGRLQQAQPMPSTSQLVQSPIAPVVGAAAGGVIDGQTKVQMLQAMSAASNMNLEWSRKCLEETNWDYNHAAFVFDKLQKENKIPPEAFIK